MDVRKKLRRYFALVHQAEETLEMSQQATERAAPDEAVAALEDVVHQTEPAIEQMDAGAADPEEIRRVLAGWVH